MGTNENLSAFCQEWNKEHNLKKIKFNYFKYKISLLYYNIVLLIAIQTENCHMY